MHLKIKFLPKEVKIHLSRLTVENINLTFTKSHVAIIMRHKKQTDMQNN